MKKRILDYAGPRHKGVVDPETTERFRPLSYFLNGGVDLSNTELKNNAQVQYDTEDEVHPNEQGEIQSAAMCDPRVSYFDIVEELGAAKAEEAVLNNPKPVAGSEGDASGE